MYTKKAEKQRKYPDDFKNHKVLKVLKKKRSPLTTVFATEDPDGWSIDVITYKTKSRIVTLVEMIIEKNLEDWYVWHGRMGWEEDN